MNYEAPTDPVNEIVFVDAHVENYEAILGGIDPNIQIVLLDSQKDGVKQIADYLTQRQSVDAIHIISHGSSGSLQLGTGSLTLDSMTQQYVAEMAVIKQALSEQADILIYGCDFAEGQIGQETTILLEQLTGADVAASNNETGHTDLGGDWNLEVQTGAIETQIALNDDTQENWFNLLSVTTSGGETRINTITNGFQGVDPAGTDRTTKSVAMDAGGNYVTVWESAGDIHGQRYDSGGTVQGSEFVIASNAAIERNASVAMNANGAFVVTWQQNQGTGDRDIYARLYDAFGTAVGSGFLVNETTTNDQYYAKVAIDLSGNFVVTWQGNQEAGTYYDNIYAQRYDTAGTKIGSNFVVNTTTAGDQDQVDIAMDSAGNTVVVWEAERTAGSGVYSIYGQRYNSSGVAQGGEFLINAVASDTDRHASISMNDSGHFVVTWNRQINTDSDIQAQQFNSSGVAQGSVISVTNTTSYWQDLPNVSMDAGGNFVVSWESDSQDGSGYGPYTRQYDSTGTALTTERAVATTISGDQDYAAIAYQNGKVVVTWSGNGTGDASGMFMQRYTATGGNSAPTITSNGGGVTASVSVAENTTAVTTVTATDADVGATRAYSISGGADATKFTINSSTGALSFISAPNYESPTDVGGNNVYDVLVTVKDNNGGADTQSIAVTVTNVNEAPTSIGGSVAGTEDTAKVFSWTDFNVADVDTATGGNTAVRVSTLPSDGTLQYYNGSTWLTVSVNQVLTKSTIDAGYVRFVPDANESGYDGYGMSGVGNGLQTYAQFNFIPVQSTSIVIANSGGESQVIAEGAWIDPATGWTTSGADAGAENLSTSEFTNDHDNNLYVNSGATLSQILPTNFNSSNDYSLSFEAGWRGDVGYPTPPSFRVELWAGGTRLGYVDQTSVMMVKGSFVNGTLAIDGTSFNALNGQSLTIKMVGLSNQANFDNITLNMFSRATDIGAGATMSIDITPINDAPGLTDTALSLTVPEDAGPPSGAVGSLVSAWTGGITDVDSGAAKGLAITGSNETNGTWYYTTNGGTTWTTVGTVSPTSALLLSDTGSMRLYFAPNADYNGTSPGALTVRAWDQTSGTAGSKVSTASSGGTTAFSSATDIIDVNVTAVNEGPTFTVGRGIVTTDVLFSETGEDVVVQPDGKILVVGTSGSPTAMIVTRYNSDGSLDTSFGGGDGIYSLPAAVQQEGNALTLQTDGKILLAGYSYPASQGDFLLVRLNADGSPDASFGGGDGIVTTDISSDDTATTVVVQGDGKILVGGYTNGAGVDFMVARYQADGSLDTSFGSNGIVTTSFGGSASDTINHMIVQPDGKIVVAGGGGNYDLMIVRYNSDGSLDTSFGTGGQVATNVNILNVESFTGLVIQSDGKLVACGYSGNEMVLARYNTDGSPDTSLGGTGIVVTTLGPGAGSGCGLALQSDGKMVAVGYTDTGSNNDVAVVRYNSDGTLDTSFGGGDGVVTTAIGSGEDEGLAVAIQSDGKIVVSGKSWNGTDYDIVLLRYNTDGSLDSRFGTALINTLDAAPTFIGGGMPVVLDADVQIFDAELSTANNFNGATLTLVRNGGANAEDVFSATGTLGALSAASGNVVIGGTTIGTYTNSGGTLMVAFNGNATNVLVNSAMRQIAYSNSSDSPPGSVQINWTFSDHNNGSQGSGGSLTTTGSVTVSITPVNDAPISAGGSVTGVEDTPLVFTWVEFNISDVDSAITANSALQIRSLPVLGSLQTLVDGDWKSVVVNQIITKATIDAGNLRYVPVAEQSGYDGYGISGVGNERNDYAQFNFAPVQGTPIMMNNPNAEADVITEGTQQQSVTGWTVNTVSPYTAGVENPTTAQFSRDHDNAFFVEAGGTWVGQILYTHFNSTNDYVLSLNVGWQSGFPTSQYRIELWAGGTGLGTIDQTQVAEIQGSFTQVTMQVNGGAFASQDGQWFGLWMIGDSGRTYFDNFELISYDRNAEIGTTATMTIDITPVNGAPTNLSLSANTVAENAANGASVGTITGTDPDNGDTLSYTLTNTAGGRFAINGNTGEITVANGTLLDYEAATSHSIAVRVTDSSGLTYDKVFTINLTDINEAPTSLSLVGNTVAENAANGTTVGAIAGTDPDNGDNLSYTLTNTAGGRFAINGNTGEITVANGTLLDYETATSHDITVRITDSGGLTYDKIFTINLTDINEAPTDLSLTGNSVAENSPNNTLVAAAIGVDPDSGDTLSYTLADTAGGRFAINSSTGEITILDTTLLDYETTTSHNITVRVTDSGGLAYDKVFTINLADSNEAPIDLSLTGNTVAENAPNGTLIGTVTEIDPDGGDTPSYSLMYNLGGRFAINSSTGEITVANTTLLDYEAATSHNITVRTTDSSGLAYDKTFTINLTDSNEAPTDLSLTGNAVTENAANGTSIGTVAGTDPDNGDTLSYTLTNTAGGRFAINSSTGEITVANGTLLDYETATSHDITVRITDSGGLTYDKVFTINLTDINEAPTDLNLTGNTVAENATNGTPVGMIAGTDPDNGDTLSYTLTNTAGGRFAINSSTGEITVANGMLLDYEAAASHSITVRITDSSGLTYDKTFAINLVNVNEAPINLSLAGNSVAENALNGTPVGTVSGIDPDNGSILSYTLTNTAGGRFAINSSTGEITVANGTLLDYETATSHSIAVRVTDSSGLTYDKTFTVNLTNVNEAPTNLSLAGNSVAENAANGTPVGTVAGTDPDSGDILSYTLIDTADGRFAINSSTGEITVANGMLLDYEAATHHSITVRVTDSGGQTYSETFTINLTNGNKAPINIVPDSQTVNKNTPLTLGGISVSDADNNLNTVQLVVAHGTLNIALSGTASISAGSNGTNSLTLSGSLADINATLASLIYQGSHNYIGTDTLSVISSDRDSARDIDTVIINVIYDNSLPVGLNDNYTLIQNAILSIEAPGLLINDSDVDNDKLSIIPVSGPENGTLVMGSNGSFTYTPNKDFVGVDSFTYAIYDGYGNSSPVTVILTVNPVVLPLPETPSPPIVPITPHSTTPVTDSHTSVQGTIPPVTPTIALPVIQNLFEPTAASVSENTTESTRSPSQSTRFLQDQENSNFPEYLQEISSRTSHSLLTQNTVVAGQQLWEEVENIQTDIQKAFDERELTTNVASVAGISLTAGVVGWLIRSGSMLASFLSIVPAWKSVDPLSIVVAKSGKGIFGNLVDSDDTEQKESSAEELFHPDK
ncbi:hypothetical protein W03_03260 [Nitrosomonas sp. PY1]|nr:hypothetical protein W03_03260 [Nitrosomonas sp. PY1]